MTKPTESELEILQVLWKHGPSSVRFVNDELSKVKEVGYTTTLKIMQIMHGKGLLDRQEEGRYHVYQPTVSEEHTQKHLLEKFVESAFGGSTMKMVMQALGGHKASDKELEEIKKLLENLKK